MLRFCDSCMKAFDDENDGDYNMQIYDEKYKLVYSYILCKDCIENHIFRFGNNHECNLGRKRHCKE